MRDELVELSDGVWERIWTRVQGLTDDEYLWEPAPGCWTIRPRPDGTWVADSVLPGPTPEPFTTLAWRLWHIIDCYGEERAPRWLGVPPQGAPIGLDGQDSAPPTAADALPMLERAHERWDAHLALVDDELLAQPIGPVAGPQYASKSKAGYVLHMLDEFVHHGAEVALLRDLWRWQHPIADDPLVEQIMRGDPAALDAAEPDASLVKKAAHYGRWELVEALVEGGAPMSTSGVTPLHLAAGAGEIEVVRLLLDRGADPTLRDSQFQATPAQWAEFLHRDAVVELLAERRDPTDR